VLNKETIKLTVTETLAPKFEAGILSGKLNLEQAKKSFEGHMKILSDYIYENYSKIGYLNIDFMKWLHRLLYPKDFKIIVQREWIRYENIPWEWRLHDYNPQIPTSYWSKQCDIEKDLYKFTNEYNLIQNKTIANILKYYFDFLRVHPFSDSNLTVVSIICDLECTKYWVLLLNMLDIRFKDSKFMYYITTYYEENIQKNNILEEIAWFISDFHNNNLSQKIIDMKNKQTIYSTSKLF